MKDAVQRLDALMQKLVEADQTGKGIDPLRIAQELGEIRQLFFASPVVRPVAGGKRHFRCDSCGTITHADDRPAKCPECGHATLYVADLEQPNVESGAG